MNEKNTEDTFYVDRKDFSGWYNEIIDRAGIVDRRYPVKGMPVFLGYGYFIHDRIMRFMEEIWNRTEHQKMLFPALIPENLFTLEAHHIKGFEGDVYWIEKAGFNELEERLLLRPTSEVPMYHMFSLWIRTHNDLPFKIYQTCAIYRYETKSTRPLIRAREVPWNEAHTAHDSFKDAERQIAEAWAGYDELFEKYLGITGIKFKRPEWDKFPGAVYTSAMDLLMPDGKVLQIVGCHNLGQNFSKVYGIVFEKPDGTKDYVWQTSYGVSTRLLASVISVHGDNRGLILPPEVAPVQVVIIPIIFKGKEEIVMNKCMEVKKMLSENGIRVKIDERTKTPGNKYYYWEMKGVPLRIDIGPKDVEKSHVVCVRRDNREKYFVKEDSILEFVKKILAEIFNNISKKYVESLNKHIHNVESIDSLKDTMKNGGFARVPFCSVGEDGLACNEKIKEMGYDVRGTLYGSDELPDNKKCIVCGKEASNYVYIAKSY